MFIEVFKLEEWLSRDHKNIKYDIAQTSEDAITLRELLEFANFSPEEFQNNILDRQLNYGYPLGNPNLRKEISKLYKTIEKNQIITTHGAIGGNHILLQSVLSKNDHVITVMPAYQQLYSIPKSVGAEVTEHFLKIEDNYELKIDDLEKLIKNNTVAIIINNPNNPTGLLFNNEKLNELVEFAKKFDLYIISDEAYRHIKQVDEYSNSIADLYEKGVSISTASKICSIPGVRIGWIVTKNKEILNNIIIHREYSTVSCSIIDEYIAEIALSCADKIIRRNVKMVSENLKTLESIVGRAKLLSYVKPGGGTTALIHYDLDMDSFKFANSLLENYGVYVVPGDTFEMPKTFRVGTTVNSKVFEAAMLKIEEFVNKF